MILYTPQPDDADLLTELRETLVLIALASAVIASPKTPVIVARVAAIMVQHTAVAWADLLDGAITEQVGGL